VTERSQTIFYFLKTNRQVILDSWRLIEKCFIISARIYAAIQLMSFYSLPLVINEVRATEAVLNRIYDAAKLGLKGDNLALAAGLLPKAYRQLCELDPIAEMAEQKDRAEGEMTAFRKLHQAAAEGDAKANPNKKAR